MNEDKMPHNTTTNKLTTTELDLLFNLTRVRFSTTVSDLGLLVNSQLGMDDHVQ